MRLNALPRSCSDDRARAPLRCGLVTLFLALSCTAKQAPAGLSCPNDLPASCPSAAPSYSSDIVPLIETRCFPCHDVGGLAGPNWLLTSYDAVYARRMDVLTQVYACAMPPLDGVQPTSDERKALLDWLICLSPNN
jgi:hypothetical protein